MGVDSELGADDLLVAVTPRRWSPAVFGVVPPGASRRRPSDMLRAVVAAVVVALAAFAADDVTELEHRSFDLVASLPGWLRDFAEFCYLVGAVVTVGVLLVALLLARRTRVALECAAAGLCAWAIALGLRAVVDSASARSAAGLVVDGSVPEHPVVVLAVATTVLLVAGPYLLRPARRLVFALLDLAALGAAIAVVGLPNDVIGGLALGWGVAAVFHLVVGTPAATPSIGQVDQALAGLGVAVSGLRLADGQVWGETRFGAIAPDGGTVSVNVIGRDALDARLFAKVWRWIWYKDSGPTLTLTRTQQLEHRAYLLLLAAQAGVPVSEVVIAGVGGAREIALLVLREPDGVPLTQLAPDAISDTALDDAWRNLARLHARRLAHGSMRAANVCLRTDGTTALVEFAYASADAPPERLVLDAVELLVTTAELVGADRALAAASRALDRDDLANVLQALEPAALSAPARQDLHDAKAVLGALRDRGASLTGEAVAKPTELRRVSPADLLLAAGAILGVYLLIGQLANVDFATMFDDVEWGWVAIAFLLSPLPQFTGAIAMTGAVAAPLPYKAVVAEQFANNFTGLVGGTVATTALVIRFFQKQGQKVAVAVSSGVLVSLSAAVVQTILVIVGLLVTGSDFSASGTGGKGIAGVMIVVVVVAGTALGIALLVPKLRQGLRAIVKPQWNAARGNLRDLLTTPRKAAMLFGGNLGSQVLYACVIGASLRAYGSSLPLLQLIVVNSLASVLGGMAPVPGGMGVVEAGMIGGLTAAGVPQSDAVAATFTARLFTSYLPPIWGWFALRWLRQRDYV